MESWRKRICRAISLIFLSPFIAMFCFGHYQNHTQEWMEKRRYRSEGEIIVRILKGCWDWVRL